MKMTQFVVGLCGLLIASGAVRAETKVELKNVHLCCGQCIKIVGGILKKEGVSGKCDQKGKTVTIAAADDAAAQKAVDALTAAGFHGISVSEQMRATDALTLETR